MRRRDFITVVGASVATAAFPRIALAQQAAKVPRIVYLSPQLDPAQFGPFQQGLADYGYIDGKNIIVETFISPTNDDLPAFAAKAVASKPDIIMANGALAAPAAKNATTTIPIVFVVSDALGNGLVTNLADPGGNLTGNTGLGPEIVGKQVEIMSEVIPALKRIALLNLPTSEANVVLTAQAAAAAKMLGIEPVIVDFVQGDDFAGQWDRVVATDAQAVYDPISSYFAANRDLLFDLQIRTKLPIISSATFDPPVVTPFVGVVSYGANNSARFRQAAAFIDAILKGAKPGDLPVRQPSVFDFAVNLDAAKKIGITIPPSILAQATMVIDYGIRAPRGTTK